MDTAMRSLAPPPSATGLPAVQREGGACTPGSRGEVLVEFACGWVAGEVMGPVGERKRNRGDSLQSVGVAPGRKEVSTMWAAAGDGHL